MNRPDPSAVWPAPDSLTIEWRDQPKSFVLCDAYVNVAGGHTFEIRVVIDTDLRVFIDQVTIAGTEFVGVQPGPPITAATMRAHLGQFLDEVKKRSASRPERIRMMSEAADQMAPRYRDKVKQGLVGREDGATDVAARVAVSTRATKPGRRPKSEEHYKWVARRFIELLALGDQDIHQQLAKEHCELHDGAKPVTSTSVNRWLAACADRGFLTEPIGGRGHRGKGPNFPSDEQRDNGDANG